MVVRPGEGRLEGFLHLVHSGKTLEALGDAAVRAQQEGPRLVEPAGNPAEAPFVDQVGEPPFVEVPLDLVRVVVDLHVDEIGPVPVPLLQLGDRIDLGPAGGAGAEGRRGEYDDGGAGRD